MYAIFIFVQTYNRITVLNKKQGKVKKIHKLKELWEELTKEINVKDNDFNMLIDVLNIIDDDGCKLRYSNDGKGNNYNEKPCFVRSDLILETTKNLYNFLIEQVFTKKVWDSPFQFYIISKIEKEGIKWRKL